MPVFSYLAYPVEGEREKLINEFKTLDYCDVTPAENNDVLILVTDTPDEQTEKTLQKQLSKLPSLQSYSMTFGHVDE